MVLQGTHGALGTSRVCAGGRRLQEGYSVLVGYVLAGYFRVLTAHSAPPGLASPAQREGGPAHLHALDPEVSGVVRIRVRKRRRECSLARKAAESAKPSESSLGGLSRRLHSSGGGLG